MQSLQEMLPYFAAAGHNLYAKSVHIYLQQMLQLQKQHPDVYAFFNTVVRLGNRAGANEKHEIDRWIDKRSRNGRVSTHTMAPIYASMC